jgi:RNA polymerase sigma factor (TIGR02999 family)
LIVPVELKRIPKRSAEMSHVTHLIDAVAAGDQMAAAQLLPIVYDELRSLAAARLAAEKRGQTLQATALVHEAYLRLVDAEKGPLWDGRGHFFAAAAEAMRRILVDRARGKARFKRGGDRQQVNLSDIPCQADQDPDLLLTLDEAMNRLADEDRPAAAVAQLHLFAGLPIEEAASSLGISRATAYRNWLYARAWLQNAIGENP